MANVLSGAIDFFRSQGTELFHLATKTVPNQLGFSKRRYHQCSDPIEGEKGKGLYVLIHGLFGHPSIFDSHLEDLETDPNVDFFCPYVPKNGNCKVEEALFPILVKILDYLKKHPFAPLCLIGASNGGRITLCLEFILRKLSPQTPIKVSNIAGAHLGSSTMKWIDSLPLLRHLYDPDIRKELSYNSDKNQRILAAVKKPFHGLRRYAFYRARYDTHVPDPDSTWPTLEGKPAEYCEISGCGHSSIVSQIKDQQLAACRKWMNESRRHLACLLILYMLKKLPRRQSPPPHNG